LRQYLEEHDTQALSCLESLEDSLKESDIAQDYARLKQLITHYDFEGALEVLDIIMRET
jgi:hypothetical protein